MTNSHTLDFSLFTIFKTISFILFFLPSICLSQKWELITPSLNNQIPSPRASSAYVYDSSSRQLVLFGGKSYDGNIFDDTWIYNLTSNLWQRPSQANDLNRHPQARFSTIYGLNTSTDGTNYLVVGFGKGLSSTIYNDVWSLNLRTLIWSQIIVPSNSAPAPRYAAVGGIDTMYIANNPISRRETYFLISHGTNDDKSFSDTFVLTLGNSTRWIPVTINSQVIPSPRTKAISHLTSPQTLIMHGGCVSNLIGPCITNESWQLQLYFQQTNSTLSIGVNNPTATLSSNPSPTLSPSAPTVSIVGESPIFVFGSWSRLVPSKPNCPGRRTDGVMSVTFPAANLKYTIMYGGNYGDFSGPKGQIAIMNTNGDWTTMLPAFDSTVMDYPEPRQHAAFVSMDPLNSNSSTFLMFGGTLTPSITKGSRGYRDSNDLWILRLGDSSNPFKNPFETGMYKEIRNITSFPVLSGPFASDNAKQFYSQAYLASCPNVDFVDPQGDGIPKVDYGGNVLPLDILPNPNGQTLSSFITIHSTLMFLSFGALTPIGALIGRYATFQRRAFVHGIIFSVATLFALVSFTFAILMNQSYGYGRHFASFHSWLGLILLICVLFLVSSAFMNDNESSNSVNKSLDLKNAAGRYHSNNSLSSLSNHQHHTTSMKEIDLIHVGSFMMPGSANETNPPRSLNFEPLHVINSSETLAAVVAANSSALKVIHEEFEVVGATTDQNVAQSQEQQQVRTLDENTDQPPLMITIPRDVNSDNNHGTMSSSVYFLDTTQSRPAGNNTLNGSAGGLITVNRRHLGTLHTVDSAISGYVSGGDEISQFSDSNSVDVHHLIEGGSYDSDQPLVIAAAATSDAITPVLTPIDQVLTNSTLCEGMPSNAANIVADTVSPSDQQYSVTEIQVKPQQIHEQNDHSDTSLHSERQVEGERQDRIRQESRKPTKLDLHLKIPGLQHYSTSPIRSSLQSLPIMRGEDTSRPSTPGKFHRSRSNYSTLSRIYQSVRTTLKWKVVHRLMGYFTLIGGLINLAVGVSLDVSLSEKWLSFSVGWIFVVLILFIIGDGIFWFNGNSKSIFFKILKFNPKSHGKRPKSLLNRSQSNIRRPSGSSTPTSRHTPKMGDRQHDDRQQHQSVDMNHQVNKKGSQDNQMMYRISLPLTQILAATSTHSTPVSIPSSTSGPSLEYHHLTSNAVQQHQNEVVLYTLGPNGYEPFAKTFASDLRHVKSS